MVIVLGSHHSEKARVIKGYKCCVFAYDNCLWKQGHCIHLKLLLLFPVQPRSQEPWILKTICGESGQSSTQRRYIVTYPTVLPSVVRQILN